MNPIVSISISFQDGTSQTFVEQAVVAPEIAPVEVAPETVTESTPEVVADAPVEATAEAPAFAPEPDSSL